MTPMSTYGVPGSGSVIGQAVELVFPRALALAPWSEKSFLVADWGGNRVVETSAAMGTLEKVRARRPLAGGDLRCESSVCSTVFAPVYVGCAVSGVHVGCMRCEWGVRGQKQILPLKTSVLSVRLYVQVWADGIESPYGVAASTTLLAVSQATPTIARVLVYDLGGSLVASFGGAALGEGSSCCAGSRLGMPTSLAVSDPCALVEGATPTPSWTYTPDALFPALAGMKPIFRVLEPKKACVLGLFLVPGSYLRTVS